VTAATLVVPAIRGRDPATAERAMIEHVDTVIADVRARDRPAT
jgi:DNA-binding GntR family transcriptional regulator